MSFGNALPLLLSRLQKSNFRIWLHYCLCFGFQQQQKDKRLKLQLNGNRKLIGILRGYDAFLNVVMEEVTEATQGTYLGQVVIRGNSIVQFEALERVN